MQNWVHRISCACIMNFCNLNHSSCKKTARDFLHFCYNYPFAHVFMLLCCILSSYGILSANQDFFIHPFRAQDRRCGLHYSFPSSPSFSLWIKMSLAVQLWLTPSVPHPTEQLPLFDESGPVCFPAPPGVWCMTALPLKMQLYSTQSSKRQAEQAAPPPTILFTEHLKT